jgi:hypothetical protein
VGEVVRGVFTCMSVAGRGCLVYIFDLVIVGIGTDAHDLRLSFRFPPLPPSLGLGLLLDLRSAGRRLWLLL